MVIFCRDLCRNVYISDISALVQEFKCSFNIDMKLLYNLLQLIDIERTIDTGKCLISP